MDITAGPLRYHERENSSSEILGFAIFKTHTYTGYPMPIRNIRIRMRLIHD